MNEVLSFKDCVGCRHLDHTGAFTSGGAKNCCNHDTTCEVKGNDCFKRVIKDVHKPPSWCPLRTNGEKSMNELDEHSKAPEPEMPVEEQLNNVMQDQIDLLGNQDQVDALFLGDSSGDTMAQMEELVERIAIEDDAIKQIEKDFKARKEVLQSCKTQMYHLLMNNNCANGHKFDNGILIKPKVKTRIFKAAGVDDDMLFLWLRGKGLGDIIKEVVYHQTLTATMKEQLEMGNELDTDIFNKSDEFTTAFAGNGKAKFLKARQGE